MTLESGTCLVHLVWAPLGPEALARFLESYRRHDPGAPHGLLVLLNGFQAGEDLAPWRRLLAGVEHEELRFEWPLLDLAAYREAVERFPAERYCFLNSHSEPLVAGWLAKLCSALEQPGVGLAGATGSWASTRSYALFHLGLPSPYRRIYRDRRATIAQFATHEYERSGVKSGRGLRSSLDTSRALLSAAPRFPPFPASHLRTNAFMVRRELLLRVLPLSLSDKAAAYRVESGWKSVTREMERMGLRVLVVDRFGRSFEPRDWPESETFWQGDQRGLLVADNQTTAYEHADADRRLLLSRFAWGERATPSGSG